MGKNHDKIEIGKSSAVERLSARLLKDALTVLPIHLAFIFNLSLDTGVFPSAWKQANVILIPKDGASTDPRNYRPISFFPFKFLFISLWSVVFRVCVSM